MDMASLVNAINDTFRQVESENRTKIITDESGTNRMLIGRTPNGEYVIAITKPGVDVVKELS